ncbi:hypothetical protein O181_022971 [Austropuccinia psidii MF-1]|uniref:BZIP domain-containing protein n=1 Tax=Austropuccinia psidii MF-1 TaxID=1389203 RepID=A0A9Q3CDY4_9BASI|nr:hypothetical protein [Austropuccinia psidii MF-1]
MSCSNLDSFENDSQAIADLLACFENNLNDKSPIFDNNNSSSFQLSSISSNSNSIFNDHDTPKNNKLVNINLDSNQNDNHHHSLDLPNHPLDFLNFPTDSESDDPDFIPPNLKLDKKYFNDNSSLTSNSKQKIQIDPKLSQETHTNSNYHPSIIQSKSNLNSDSNLNPDSSINQSSKTLNFNHQIDFDFSTLSNHHFNDSNLSSNSLVISKPDSQSNQKSISFDSNKTQIDSSNQSNNLDPNSNQNSSNQIPFINIPLPDSDDSPEFIPQPIKKNRSDVIKSNSSLSSSNQLNHTNSQLKRPSKTQSSSSHLHHRNHIKLPQSITSRYVAIAPSPSAFNQDSVQALSPDSNTDSDQGSSSHLHLIKNGQLRSKPGPKPKLKRSLDLSDQDDLSRKKRDRSRAIRERKKEYIEELEKRCLALAEENAFLKQENEQLIRESRENWRAKALGIGQQIPSTTSFRDKSHNQSDSRPSSKSGSMIASRGRTVLDVLAKRNRSVFER